MDERPPKTAYHQESTHTEGPSQRQTNRLLAGNFAEGEEGACLGTHRNQPPGPWHAVTEPGTTPGDGEPRKEGSAGGEPGAAETGGRRARGPGRERRRGAHSSP